MKSARQLLWIGTLFLALLGTPCKALDVNPFSLMNFQLSGLGAWSGSSNAYFAQVSWTPYFGLGPVGIRGEVGITGLDFGFGRFLATNYEALLHVPFFPAFSIEAGGGVHLWHNQNPLACAFTVNLVMGVPVGLDRVFVGYTRYTGGLGANELRVGVGAEL
jgi:hypothetical protein